MERITIMLPPALKNRAKKRAKALGISFGEFVRGTLEAGLRLPRGKKRDPLWQFVEYKGRTPPDLAENHDAYLYGDKK